MNFGKLIKLLEQTDTEQLITLLTVIQGREADLTDLLTRLPELLRDNGEKMESAGREAHAIGQLLEADEVDIATIRTHMNQLGDELLSMGKSLQAVGLSTAPKD